MKRNLLVKLMACAFIGFVPLFSFAATATTTSDYFEVDTTVKLIPESANWSEGSITLCFTDGGVAGSEDNYVVYFRDAIAQSEEGWEEIPYSESERMWHRDADGRLTLTDPKFATRLGGIPPVEYLVMDNNSVVDGQVKVWASCITRKKHGIFIAPTEYDRNAYNDKPPTKLPNAGKYAKDFMNLAVQRGGMKGEDAYVLEKTNAKYGNLLWAFEQVANKTKNAPGDICLIYFNTHGGIVPDGNTTLTLCLYDTPQASGFRADDPKGYGYHEALLARDIKSLDPEEKGVAVFCIIGACHSGAAINSGGEMACSASEKWCQRENLNENNIAFLTAATTDSVATDILEMYLLDWGWKECHAYSSSSSEPLTARMLAEYAKNHYDDVYSDFILKGETVKREAIIDNKELLSKLCLGLGASRPTGSSPTGLSITDATKGRIPHAIDITVQFGSGGGTYIMFKKCGEGEPYEICTNISRNASVITDSDVEQSSCDNPYTYCFKRYNGFGVSRLSNENVGWRRCIVATFDANGGVFNATATKPREATRKLLISTLVSADDPAIPIPVREGGYSFDGWSLSKVQKQLVSQVGGDSDGRITYYAYWKRDSHSVSLYDRPRPTFSQTYTFTSYLQLPDDGGVAGTMTVKTQKAKDDVASATVTIQTADGKKQTIKGTISVADGTGQGALAGLTFTSSGVTGTLNGYSVDGAMDASKSKDAETVAVLNAFKGKAYVMALEPKEVTGENAAMVNGIAGFSVVFASKGKAKVTGALPDGTKVSASSRLIVGSEWCCLPIVYPKAGNSLAFMLWFDRAGNFDSVSGLTTWKGKGFEVTWNDDVAASKVGNLSGTSYFHLADSPTEIRGAEVIPELLPVDVAITPAGAKWNIAKAKAVKLDRSGNLSYGANPSGLKLTYAAKTGMFKGSLSLYTMNRGRLKKNRVSISGIVVNGVGYGTATLKKVGCWPIVINAEAAKAAD